MSPRLIVLTGAVALLLSGCGGGGTPAPPPAPMSPPSSPAPTKLITGSPTFDRISKRGKLVVGLAESPGLASQDPTGGFTGFEVEIGHLLAGRLGLSEDDVLFKKLPAGLRRQAVAGGDVDVQIGGITDGSAQPGELSVAGPYLVSPPAVLTPAGAPSGAAGVAGRPVCVLKDSTALAALQQDGLSLRTGDTIADCAGRLEAGQVAGLADDAAALLGYASTRPGGDVVTPLPGAPTRHDIGLRARDTAFQAALNRILRTSIQNGDWQRRYDRTLGKSGGPALAPPMDASVNPATPTPSH